MENTIGRRSILRAAGAALAMTVALSLAPRALLAAGPTPPTVDSLAAVLPLPIGKKLTAFSKNGNGATAQTQVAVKVCQGQITEEMTNLYLRAKIDPGPCDEGFSKAVLNGYLIATSNVIRRRPDLRGAFDGQWRLVDASGSVLALGDWSGTVGVGSHRSPGAKDCEHCSDPEHYEGKLDGKVVVHGPYAGSLIRATFAGTGPLQPNTAQRISFEGVVISECIPASMVPVNP
jgi:hypothetical protein